MSCDVNDNELSRLCLDLIPQAIMIVDSGRVIYRNQAAELMLQPGGTLDETLSCVEGQALPDWAGLQQALTGGILTFRCVCLAGPQKRRLWADVHFRPIPGGPKASPSGLVLAMVEDISERAAMQRRLAADERFAAEGRLTRRFAHELNNPLDGAMRYIGLARRDISSGTADEYLAKALAALERMAGIIRSEAGPGHAGRHAARLERLDRLLQDAADAMRPRAETIGVAVSMDLPADAAPPADTSLFQVFCNIIKNALDAMPSGGLLGIRLRRDGGQIRVEFADSGGGFPAEDAEKLFLPFYTTKPAGQGAGLGLAICREILERLGGAITAAPRHGGGAVFTVCLPASADNAASGGENQTRAK